MTPVEGETGPFFCDYTPEQRQKANSPKGRSLTGVAPFPENHFGKLNNAIDVNNTVNTIVCEE